MRVIIIKNISIFVGFDLSIIRDCYFHFIPYLKTLFISYEIVKCEVFFRKYSSINFYFTCCWFVSSFNFAQGEGKAMAKGATIFHKEVKAVKLGATNRSSKERKLKEERKKNSGIDFCFVFTNRKIQGACTFLEERSNVFILFFLGLA